MDILHRASYASASVRALPEVVVVADGSRQASAPTTRMRSTAMPGLDQAWLALGKPSVGAMPLACSGDLRADDAFSTRWGPSAGPPV